MLFKRFYLIIGLVFSSASAQYITTDESRTAVELIEDVLINSGCANISNVSVSGGNFASGEKSWGYFNAAGTNFPFEEGIILSTGKIINTQGPNETIYMSRSSTIALVAHREFPHSFHGRNQRTIHFQVSKLI